MAVHRDATVQYVVETPFHKSLRRPRLVAHVPIPTHSNVGSNDLPLASLLVREMVSNLGNRMDGM